MTEAAKKNGQPCARCEMKAGAHDYPNKHPKACREWLTAAELLAEREEERLERDFGWMLDPDMEAKG